MLLTLGQRPLADFTPVHGGPNQRILIRGRTLIPCHHQPSIVKWWPFYLLLPLKYSSSENNNIKGKPIRLHVRELRLSALVLFIAAPGVMFYNVQTTPIYQMFTLRFIIWVWRSSLAMACPVESPASSHLANQLGNGNPSQCSSWTKPDRPSPSMACLPYQQFPRPFRCSTVDVWAFDLHNFYTCVDALWPLTRALVRGGCDGCL